MNQEELLVQLQNIQSTKSALMNKASIFVVPPFLLWLSFRKNPSLIERRALRILGVGLLIYNVKKYRDELLKLQAVQDALTQFKDEDSGV